MKPLTKLLVIDIYISFAQFRAGLDHNRKDGAVTTDVQPPQELRPPEGFGAYEFPFGNDENARCGHISGVIVLPERIGQIFDGLTDEQVEKYADQIGKLLGVAYEGIMAELFPE